MAGAEGGRAAQRDGWADAVRCRLATGEEKGDGGSGLGRHRRKGQGAEWPAWKRLMGCWGVQGKEARSNRKVFDFLFYFI
jgi:hypothetical protein